MDINKDLVKKIQKMHANGCSVSQMLFEINEFHSGHPQIKLLAMRCLKESLGLSVSDISTIGGWSGFGGELSDEQINALVSMNLHKEQGRRKLNIDS